MTSRTVTVLLVEDNAVDREAIQRAFDRMRIANPIVCAGDGAQALEILRGTDAVPPMEKPLLILLDINMPRMNGLEFLKQMRADPQLHDNIVFVLTTSKSDEDRMAAYAEHVAGYIVKSDVGAGF